MSIDYNATAGQNINYGSIMGGLSKKSILFWAYKDTNVADGWGLISKSNSSPARGWYTRLPNDGAFIFEQYWTTTPGGSVLWYTAGGLVTTGTWHHFAITYDWTSTSNDALLYMDGIARSTSHAQSPSGSPDESNADPFLVGSLSATSKSIDGKLASVLIYNRILSAAEISAAYTNGLTANPLGNYVPSQDGLVFRLNTACAKGLTYASFPGSVLGSSNKVMDMINCYEGTPANSPSGL